MTYLGDANFPGRLLRSLAGLVRRPKASHGPSHPVWVIGHRGAARQAPENTLASFRKALDLGADGIETDVCVTQDGCFVLWHDAEPSESVALVRQAGAEGSYLYLPALPGLGSDLRRPVRDCQKALFLEHYGYTLADKGFESSLGGARRPEVPPAVLEDLLDWAPRDPRLKHVFLDLKPPVDRKDEVVRLLRLLSERVRRPDHRPDLTYHLLEAQREIVSALVAETKREPSPDAVRVTGDFELPGVVRGARRHGFVHVAMGAGRRTWGDFRFEVGGVVRARRRGRVASVVTWTVNDEDRLRELVALGVDGIVTDDAAVLRAVVGSV
ncbi:MAG TPA: glycerophosphodiester phosphodiesterase [Thermoanaerobaculia bacterium]|nr:glycerophosphodiester phosphodiesterase [Thermoanaerobaculia bacterium]